MALVVENGTGLATADSYLSVDEYREFVRSLGLWHLNQAGPTSAWFDSQSVDELEAALRRGTLYLDATYHDRWVGAKASWTQGLDWPRLDGRQEFDYRAAMYAVGRTSPSSLAWPYNGDALGGLPVGDREVPRQVRQALAQIATRELASPGGLLPDSTDGAVVQESVGGAISVKYEGARLSVDRIPMVEALLGPLLVAGVTKQLRRA